MPSKPNKVLTGKVRFSYCRLFTPQANDQGADVWSMLLLIPKTDKTTVAALRKAAAVALEAGIANGKLKAGTKLESAWGTLKDGDEHDEVDDRPEYRGVWYMNVNAYRKPGVVDRNRDEIVDPSDVYSGCYGRVTVSAYAYNKGVNKGVTFGLENVQKLTEGEPLDGRSLAIDDFDDDMTDEYADDADELV